MEKNTNDREVIGSWCLCNAASLNVYEIIYGIDDVIVAGINNDEPEEYIVNCADDGDSYIEFGGEKYSLSECMRAS